MSSPIITEICVDSIDSVIQAHSAFIETLILETNKVCSINNNTNKSSSEESSSSSILRFELCSALHQGGLTPSVGFVQTVIDTLSKTFASSSSLSSMYHIELFLMIRSRPGLDFTYSYNEVEVMLKDIELFGKLFGGNNNLIPSNNKNVFIRGIVFGALKRTRQEVEAKNSNSRIEKAIGLDLGAVCSIACRKELNWTVTFHRAIDYLGEDAKPLTIEDSSLYFEILNELATRYKNQVEFVLTSGGITHNTSENDTAVVDFLMKNLLKDENKKNLKIILGGGVNKQVIEKVVSLDNNNTFYGVHFSGKKVVIPQGVPSAEAYWTLDQKLVHELFITAASLMMSRKTSTSDKLLRNSHV